MYDAGSSDLRAAAVALRTRLPEPLGPLAAIAYNYRWSWTPGGPELFADIDPRRWELTLGNPVRQLQEAHPDRLAQLAAGRALPRARRRARERGRHRRLPAAVMPAGVTEERPVAFFCAEYAIHGSLPVYSGGLGVLAGDILKESSDRGVPLIAVGLMYRHGYFRQRIDGSGWQHEYWVETDPDRVPAALVTGDDGEPLTVSVPVVGRDVVAQVWRVDVGRVPLLLLDADRPENSVADRWITSRLYVGDPEVRLWQYALLGVGGVRVLHALGVEPGVVHLNEGHAALAGLEVARAATEVGVSGDDALAAARERTVFTTHTPVPAGNDTYPAAQIAGALAPLVGDLGMEMDSLVRRGRTHPDEAAEPFGVTQFALRAAAAPTASAPATARSPARCGRTCGPTARRGRADRPRHQRRPHPDLDRRADARAARPPPRRRLDGPRHRAGHVGRGRLDARRRAVGRALRPAARPRRPGARPQRADRLGRGDTLEYVARPPRRSTPTR